MEQTHRERIRQALYEYVLDYGWSVVPIKTGAKHPWVPWKEFQTRQPTEDEINEWCDNGAVSKNGHVLHDFDICLVTGALSGVVVVDCDNQEAVDEARKLGLASNVSVNTKKGLHFYWHHTGDAEYKNKVGGHTKAGDVSWPKLVGLDFRGDKGIAVLPPSRHAEGNYTWNVRYDDLDYTKYLWSNKTFLRDVEKLNQDDVEALLAGQLPDLTNVGPDKYQPMSIEDEIIADGGVVREGGRNHALTRYVGQVLNSGMTPNELEREACEFVAKYMGDNPLPDEEIQTVVASVVQMDRANKPWRYDAEGNFLHEADRTDVAVPSGEAQPLLRREQANQILEDAGNEPYLMFPAISHPSIVQVYGFSGHGKSLFLGHLLYGLATGNSFASFECMRKGRILYLDFENGLVEIADRLNGFYTAFEEPDDDEGFGVYTPSLKDASVIDLRTDQGLQELIENARTHRADVIVIDTLRTAFSGFDENRQQDWSRVNNVMLFLRNQGYSVIGVHHANKPQVQGSGGLSQGTEAGSTNQLTVLETQMRVTQIFPDDEEGIQRAEEVRGVVDANGYRTIVDMKWRKEQNDNEAYRLKTAIRVSYGKVRRMTDAHKTTYIGFAEDSQGRPIIIATKPLRERIKHQAERGGANGQPLSVDYLATYHNVGVRTIREWLKVS